MGALEEMRLPQRSSLKLWYCVFYRGASKQDLKE